MAKKATCENPCSNCFTARKNAFRGGCKHHEENTYQFWMGVSWAYRELVKSPRGHGKMYEAYMAKYIAFRRKIVAKRFPCLLSPEALEARLKVANKTFRKKELEVKKNQLLDDI